MQKKICVIYLVHGSGLEDFLENSLMSLRQSGYSLDVIVYATPDAIQPGAALAERYHAQVLRFNRDEIQSAAGYFPYGTHEFNSISLKKFGFIIQTLRAGYECVVYSDVDIAYAADFSPYLSNVLKTYSCGIQSESQSKFPPTYCAGFMFFTAGALGLLEELREKSHNFADIGNDQDLLNLEISQRNDVAKEILLLPEGLFQNGLYFQTYQTHDFSAMRGKLQPFLFHANFVVGLEAKRKLLELTGHWHLRSDL